MNSTQLKQIRENVTRYFNIEVEEFLAAAYPDALRDEKVLGEYSVQDLVYFSHKVMHNFRDALDRLDFIAFPAQYQLNNEYGGGELVSDIAGLTSCFESNRGQKTLAFLHRLIGYQLQNGLWNLGEKSPISPLVEEVSQAKNVLKLAEKQVERSLQKVNQAHADSKKVHADFLGSMSQFRDFMNKLGDLLQDAQNIVSAIKDQERNAQLTSEQVNSTLKITIEKKNEIDRTNNTAVEIIATAKNSYENLKNEGTILINEFTEKSDRFSEMLTEVEANFSKFQERNEYLNDLIGREVGASLFETFKQRKKELNVGVWVWRIAVPITAVFTAGWIYYLFTESSSPELTVSIFLLNSLKTLPVIGFLFFAIAQYTKERNFQEEYAFKSAVALTVNSYADQLKSDENKDRLILDSVSTIYKSPISSRAVQNTSRKNLKDAITAIKALRGDKADV